MPAVLKPIASGQIAIQENHTGFVNSSAWERCRRVARNADKSGLLIDAPAQCPADARIRFHHQYPLPVGLAGDESDSGSAGSPPEYESWCKSTSTGFMHHSKLTTSSREKCRQHGCPTLVYHYLKNLARFVGGGFRIRGAEREKKPHASMVNTDG